MKHLYTQILSAKPLLTALALLLSLSVSAQTYSRVSSHDPSIVIAYNNGGKITGEKTGGATKTYYIFGSHKAFAKSTDMKNWAYISSNIQAEQNDLFYSEIAWAKLGSNNYNVDGNLWAPDVIWNKDMQKWCMYMSVNGDGWYSSIALLTSDSPEGSWKHEGTVIYSIPWNAKESMIAAYTDFYKVTGIASGTAIPDRYKQNRNGNQVYGLNAIDPCVFYDNDGKLWMSYGSWFGGIYMIELDRATGLRHPTRQYELKGGTVETAEEDPYLGIKIYGGNHVSGEASYIESIGGRYFLFMSYGGLTANGGYNMRVFSSDNVTGPYKDMAGHDARYNASSTHGANNCPGTVNGQVGTRLMSYYKWDWMQYAQVAQGHNSVVVDDDGKIFNVYHTRFNTGNEGHEVRVHQMFLAENGGLCAAPFEYSGETVGAKAYSMADVAGWYGTINHGWGTDYANMKYAAQGKFQLVEDGTIDGAYSGSWSLDGSNITIKLRNGMAFQEFKGVVFEQKVEERSENVVCFTAVCKDQSLWGFKKYSEDEDFQNGGKPTEYTNFTVGDVSNTLPYYAAQSNRLEMTGDGSIEAKFTNYSACGANYENWVFVCNKEGATDYFALRADNWDNVAWSNEGCTNNYNWDTFIQDMNGSVVVMNAKRAGNNITADFDITTAAGTKYAYSYTKTTDFKETLTFLFTNEKSHQDFEYFRVQPATAISSALADRQQSLSGKCFNTAGQQVGDSYRGIVIKDGKKFFKR